MEATRAEARGSEKKRGEASPARPGLGRGLGTFCKNESKCIKIINMFLLFSIVLLILDDFVFFV